MFARPIDVGTYTVAFCHRVGATDCGVSFLDASPVNGFATVNHNYTCSFVVHE